MLGRQKLVLGAASLCAGLVLCFAGAALASIPTEGALYSGPTGSVNVPCPFTSDSDGNHIYHCNQLSTQLTKANVTVFWGDTPSSSSGGTATMDSPSTTAPYCPNGASGFCTYTVAGTYTYSEEGTYPVTSRVTLNGLTPSPQSTTSINVADAGLSATAVNGLTATEGAPAATVALASLGDSDPNATATDYTATVDWGDGSPDTVGTITGAGNFTVSGTHAYADEGSFPVTVTMRDTGGASTVAMDTINVGDAALSPGAASNLTALEGASFTPSVVGRFTDTNPGAPAADFTATIDWGDSTAATTGTVAALASGGFSVSGSHAYADAGSFHPTVTIADRGGRSTSTTGTITVTDVALSATPSSGLTATAGASTGTVALAGFTDADPLTTAADYTATIDWGDSTAITTGTLAALASGGFSVSGSHTYASAGSFHPTVTIIDDGGQTTSATSTIAVADAVLTATGATGHAGVEGVATGPVGLARFTDPNAAAKAGDFTASIDWGDGTSSAGGIAPVSGGGFAVTAGHTYVEEGSYDVTVTVSASGGSTTTAHTRISVADTGLTANGAGALHLNEGTPSAAVTVASFGDSDPNATASDYAATIDWGDGTAATAGTIVASGAGNFVVSGVHAYTEEGSFVATVTIKDAGGATASASTSTAVADQPLGASAVHSLHLTTSTPSGNVMVAKFTDGDPNSTASDYTATVNWGDGTAPSAATIAALSGGGFAVDAGHTYAKKGSFKVTVMIVDAGGAATSVTSSIPVAATPPPRIQSKLIWNFTIFSGYTRVDSLVVQDPPVGGRIQIRCHGRGCRIAGLTIPTAGPKQGRCKGKHCSNRRAGKNLDLTSVFRGWQLSPGALITVTVLKPGWVGRYYAFKIRGGSAPSVVVAWLLRGRS